LPGLRRGGGAFDLLQQGDQLDPGRRVRRCGSAETGEDRPQLVRADRTAASHHATSIEHMFEQVKRFAGGK